MTTSVVMRDCAGQLTRLFITSLVIIGLDCTAQYQPTRIVSTRYGRLQGIILPTTSPLTPVELYLGVPYATAPVGVNRWGPTRNPTPWMGVKVVDHFGPACPQSFPLVHPNTSQGFQSHSKSLRNKRIEILLNNQSEDCLYLNIYAPTKGRPGLTEKFPVMVLIHGESYEFGSGQLYDGSAIASHSRIIFVTLDFRLGFLGTGFLNLGHWSKGKGRLSNYGLMDQVAALHWIRQNIAEFNGDPQRITLVGHRYGASFIHFLMKSPAVVPGLFHRAILLSGSSQAPWALSPDAESIAQQFSAAAGCSSSNSSSASAASIDPTLACLRNTPLEVLQQAALGIPRRVFVPEFGPSVDGVVISHRPSAEENLRAYDFITGVTGYEAREFPSDSGRELLETLVGETYRFHQVEILLTLLNEYTDWQEGRLSVQEALSDGLFVAPAVAMADSQIHKHAAGNRGYFYVMDPSLVQQMAGEWDFELSLLLGSPLQNTKHHDGEYMYSKQDVILCEAMMNLFTNFAKSGNPNEGSLSETFLISRERNYFKGLVWQTYQKSGRNFLQMGLQPKLGHNFRWHRLSIWLQLIPELHRSGQQNILEGHGRLAEDRGNKPLEETSCATPATALSRSSNSSTPASVREHETYSTALSVTIVVGCSLLIVNVLAFAGIYYWRDQRHKRAILAEDGVPDFSTRDCARSSYEMRPNGHPPDPTIFYTSTGSQTLRNYGKPSQLGSSSEQHLVRQSAARNVLFDTSVAIPPDKTFIVSDAMMI